MKIAVSLENVLSGGKCSVCGEAADLKTQVLGVGGSMYLGKIVRTYNQGATVPVTVVVSSFNIFFSSLFQSLL